MLNYPILYEPKAVFGSFSAAGEHTSHTPNHDGLGTLRDAAACEVTWDTDGRFELDLTYPAGGLHAGALLLGCDHLLGVKLPRLGMTPPKGRQFFRIVSVEERLEKGSHTLTVHAEHLYYDLKWEWCGPVDKTSNDPEVLAAAICSAQLSGDGNFIIDPLVPMLEKAVQFYFDKPFTKLEGIQKLCELFDGFIDPLNLNVFLSSKNDSADAYAKPFTRGNNIVELTRYRDSSKAVEGAYVYFNDSKQYMPPQLVKPLGSVGASIYGVPHYTAYNYSGADGLEAPVDMIVTDEIGRNWLKHNTAQVPEETFSAVLADDGEMRLKPWTTVQVDGFEAQVQKITYDALRDRYLSVEVGGRISRTITDTLAGLVSTPSAVSR